MANCIVELVLPNKTIKMQFRQRDLVRRINDLDVDLGIANSQMSYYEINHLEFDDNYYNLLGIHDSCIELIELLNEQLKILSEAF